MKSLSFVIALMLALVMGGCAWPAVTLISGDAEIAFTPERPSLVPASQPGGLRIVVVKYWQYQEPFGPDGQMYDYLDARLITETKFSVRFPLRFYTVVWMPALATHLLPKAGLIAFVPDSWPAAVLAADGQRCCEAPTTGRRCWHIHVRPMSQSPAEFVEYKDGLSYGFPPLEAEKLEDLLSRAGNLTEQDRSMCLEQLKRFREHRRVRY